MRRKIVDLAEKAQAGIKLEDIKAFRHGVKVWKGFRYSLNSWSYYQLDQMIQYKAKLLGIPVVYVDPAYTSQTCSRCGARGHRRGKRFWCDGCGHVDHADCNAAFNIALRHGSDGRLHADRDACKGRTDTPQSGSGVNVTNHRTPRVITVGVCQNTGRQHQYLPSVRSPRI